MIVGQEILFLTSQERVIVDSEMFREETASLRGYHCCCPKISCYSRVKPAQTSIYSVKFGAGLIRLEYQTVRMRAGLRSNFPILALLVAWKLGLEEKIDGERGGRASCQNAGKALLFAHLLPRLYENFR